MSEARRLSFAHHTRITHSITYGQWMLAVIAACEALSSESTEEQRVYIEQAKVGGSNERELTKISRQNT